jgi:hypothetical protein
MISRTKLTLQRSVLCAAAALLPLACGNDGSGLVDAGSGGSASDNPGSDTGGGSGNDLAASGGDNNTLDGADLGNNLGSGGTGVPNQGGTIQLTAEQLAAIENGSCTGWTQEGENLPAVLQLVVDISLSMDTAPPGGGIGESRWTVTRDALDQAIESLPASVALGVLYYPAKALGTNDLNSVMTRPISACLDVDTLVPIAELGEPDSAQRTDLAASLMTADTNGYTPTHDAYAYALDQSLLPYQAAGNQKFMLLITDGAPTMAQGCRSAGRDTDCPIDCEGAACPAECTCPDGCDESPSGCPATCEPTQPPPVPPDVATQPIVDSVTAAMAQGIRTFVIGSPGSEVGSDGADKRPWLSKAAMEGGTALEGCTEAGPTFCHMDMTQEEDFSTALSEGLAAVAGQVVDTCSFVVPEPPQGQTLDPDTTNLIAVWGDGTATAFLRDAEGACDSGWNFDATGTQIELCPASCDQLKAGAGATVRLSFGCENIIK